MDPIETLRKDITNFTKVFIFSTETVSYTVIVPALVLYVWTNFNLSGGQLALFFKCVGIAVFISLVATNVTDRLIVVPITRYFALLLRGEDVPEEVYYRAQKRFFSLPYIHGLNSLLQWVFGLAVAIVPFSLLADLTSMQLLNIYFIMIVIPPLGGMLFFLLTETYLQKLLNKGLFNRIVIKSFNLRMNLMPRILMSIVLILVIPAVGFNGYYSVVLETAKGASSVSYLKLGGIILFGVIVAVSIVAALWRSISVKIGLISEFLRSIGRGELAAQKSIFVVIDELTDINQTVYIMKKNISSMMADINTISTKLDASSRETSSITNSFTGVTQNQAATVEEVTATIEEISAGMDQIATGAQGQMRSLMSLIERMGELSGIIGELSENISSASALAGGITEEAERGEDSLRQMNQSMLTINTGSQQMTNIVNIIQDISDKINLLSLNASIEAARAGEAGRGFAVVADEISKLAENTATSVKDIDSLIKTTDGEIRKGLSGVTDVVERIGRISAGIGEMNGMVQKIAGIMEKQVDMNAMVDREATEVRKQSQQIESATMEQKTAINEVVQSVTRINELTQTISAGSEEITANTEENAKIAEILKSKMDRFRIA